MRRAWISCVIGLAACNGGGVGGSGGVSTIDDYETAAVKTLCEYFTHCGNMSLSQESVCESRYRAAVDGSGYSLKSSIAAGRASYNASAAQACLNTVSSAACNLASLAGDTNCKGILTPKVPAGGTCLVSTQCINGLCVLADSSVTAGCPGTCKAFVAEGGDCSGTVECATPLYCDVSGSTPVCTQPKHQGDPCADSPQCASGLYCATGTSTDTCQPLPTEGQPCLSYVCATGLSCNGVTNTCQKPAPSGGSCETTYDCVAGLGCVGASSVAPGTCRPFVDVGQACGTTAACAGDAVCDPQSNLCVLQGNEGADCSATFCESFFLYCDSHTMKCARFVAVGAACEPALSGGSDPCENGACDPTTKICTLQCM